MLPTYKNILIPTDLSPNSVHAFKHAVLLARPSRANIHLLHVVPMVDSAFRSFVTSMMGEGKLEQFEARHEVQARAEIKKELEEFTRKELADRPDDLKNIAKIEVLHGDTVSTILTHASHLDADVIVMGTHGKGALEHTFLGSVTEKVLRRSKIPVFVIPIP